MHRSTQQQLTAGFVQQTLIAGTLLGTSLLLSVLVSGLIAQASGGTKNIATPDTTLQIEVSQNTPSIKSIWTLLLPKVNNPG